MLTDRSYIVTTLRVLSLSKNITIDEKTVDLSFVPSQNIPLPNELRTQELAEDNIKLNVSIPSLEKDTFVNNETRKKLAPLPDNDDFAKESIGEVFINELIKYIDSLTIIDGQQPTTIVFNELTFDQKLQIVEKLPLNLNTKLVEFINNTKTFENKYFTYNGQALDIELDPTLFTV